MICANCGSVREDAFCGHCGQNDRSYQRSLPPLLGDLIRETFEVDSRLFRTLGKLLGKPGELSAEFSRNRRASYVSPFRLYLFVSITFFFLLSLGDSINPVVTEGPETEQQLAEVANTDTGKLLAVLEGEYQSKAIEILARPETAVSRLVIMQIARGVEESTTPLEPYQRYLIDRTIDTFYEPRTTIEHLMDNLPIAVFLMLPVYALLLKIFYLGRHRYYVEHLVFATHLHTFAFIVFTALLLLGRVPAGDAVTPVLDAVTSLLWLVLVVYHYMALRRYYGGGRGATFLRFSGLMLLYSALLTPSALLIVLIFTIATI